jgi:hypothetical protein
MPRRCRLATRSSSVTARRPCSTCCRSSPGNCGTNLALTYEDGPWHAKLAWNHTGTLWDDRFPNYDSQAQLYRNRYQQPTNKIDLQLAWDVTSNVSLTFDALNLTGQGFQYNFGRSQEYVQSTWKIAPIVMVGLNMKL